MRPGPAPLDAHLLFNHNPGQHKNKYEQAQPKSPWARAWKLKVEPPRIAWPYPFSPKRLELTHSWTLHPIPNQPSNNKGRLVSYLFHVDRPPFFLKYLFWKMHIKSQYIIQTCTKNVLLWRSLLDNKIKIENLRKIKSQQSRKYQNNCQFPVFLRSKHLISYSRCCNSSSCCWHGLLTIRTKKKENIRIKTEN